MSTHITVDPITRIEGHLRIDVEVDGGAVTNEDRDADLTVSISRADLEALGRGQLDPMTAVISRRMQLSDMGLDMSLQGKMQALFARLA